MAEVLRDLVVSLSLDSDNFSRNIASINAQITEAESEFRRAGAGVSNFEQTTAGAESKVSALQKKLELQQKAVEQYQRALQAANDKLKASYDKHKQLNASLTTAKEKNQQLKEQVSSATEEYERLRKELGDDNAVTQVAREKMEALKAEYKASSEEVGKLEGQLQANSKAMQNNANAVTKAQTNLNNAEAAVSRTKEEIRQTTEQLRIMQSAWTKVGSAMTTFGEKCEKLGKNMQKVGKTLTTSLTAPIAALGTASVKAAIDFESAFTGVRKTVDATEEEYAQLSDEIKQMSTEVATSTTDIAAVMENAGQLGIRNENLVSFTRTMIDLGNSTNIAADEAATAIAQFANITGMSQDQFQNFGSTLVDLGNNFATTEADIMEMSTRLASAGHQVGLTEPQILGFATALSSVGLEAQAGGTAFSKAMIQMQVAVETGGDALKDFAKVSGMTEKQFQQLWKTDPSAAIQAFIVGLSKMDEEGISAISTLEDMGFKEVRLRDTLLRATNATELFSRAQETASGAWQQNSALSEEAGKRYATTESKLKNLKNSAVLVAQQFGNSLLPVLQKIVDAAKDLIDRFSALDENQRMQIIRLAAIVAAIGPVISILGKLTSTVGTVSTAIGKFATSVASAGGGFKGFMSVIGSSPVVWAAVAAGIVAAGVALMNYLTGYTQAKKTISEMNKLAEDVKKNGISTLYDTGTTDVLGRFGLASSDFQFAVDTSKNWLETLTAVWSDGKKETTEIVSTFTDSFAEASDSIRDGIKARRSALEGVGLLDDDAQKKLDNDAAQLDKWDAEIARLLKKRQNRMLSAKDQARLDEIITMRAQLRLEYIGVESESYDKIQEGIENEKARAAAIGETISVDVYGDALAAAAQGHTAFIASLDAEYDSRRSNLILIEDEAKRTQALAALDAWYAEQRQMDADKYKETMSGIGAEAYNNAGLQASVNQIGELYTIMQNFDGSQEGLEQVQAWMNSMDPSGLASTLAVLTQLKDAGIGEDVLGFDPAGLLAQWQAISNVASAYPEKLKGLNEVVNETIAGEVHDVMLNLNLETATAQWEGFMEGKDVFNTTLNIEGEAGMVDITGNVSLSPLDQGRVRLWKSLPGNQISLSAPVNAEVGLAFGADWSTKLNELWAQEKLKVYGTNGLPIEATPEVIAKLTSKDIVVGMSDDGTYHIIVKPEWEEATAEDVKEAISEITDPENTNNGFLGGSFLGKSGLESMKQASDYYRQYSEQGWHGLLPELGLMKHELLQWADNIITPEMAENLANTTATVLGAALNGEELPEEAIEFLQEMATLLDYIAKYGENEDLLSGIVTDFAQLGVNMQAADIPDFLRNLSEGTIPEELKSRFKTVGEEVGSDAGAGVGEGLSGYDYTEDANASAENMEGSLRDAYDSHSPSEKMKPVGEDVAAGVGAGLREYDPSGDVEALAAKMKDAMTLAVPATTYRQAGLNAMLGLRAGIIAGRALVVSAMKSAATSAVNAAKETLKIQSPSRVFRDEIGVMTMKGLGEGILAETEAQAKIIRNAARYLTGEASGGAIAATSNNKTYNANSSVNLTGNNFYVQDEQDAYAMAVEIAEITKRQQRGMGLKMA